MAVINKDVIIVGGGAGGLAAAVELRKQGIEDILIIEREKELGGIYTSYIAGRRSDSAFLSPVPQT